MPAQKPPEKDYLGEDQRERFIEAARALGCDEDEAAFDEKLKVIARHKPKDDLRPTTTKKPPREP